MKFVLLLTVLLLTACSSTKPIQDQVDLLNTRVDNLSLEVSTIKDLALSTELKAHNAVIAANRAADLAKETNDKLDLVFKKALAK